MRCEVHTVMSDAQAKGLSPESHQGGSRTWKVLPIITPMGEQAVDERGPLAIFNDPRYHALNGVNPTQVLQFRPVRGDRRIGTVVAVWDGDTLICGARAPFGGADLCDPDERAEGVVTLWQAVLEAAGEAGAHQLVVRARPDAHGAAHRLSVMAMLHLGFRVQRCWLNHAVDLTALDSPERYLHHIGAKGRNMIRSVQCLGLQTTEATTDAQWAEGHAVLAANKIAKGRAMAYDASYLVRLRHCFPTVARMVVTRQEERPVAAAVTYGVGAGIELVTAWGDANHDLPRSPMNHLAFHLVARALEEGMTLLDLGVSTDGEARPNYGLARFKESVGATAGYRLDLAASLGEHR